MKIKINDRFYFSFDEIAITYKLDSVASGFSFKARFNPNNEFHKAIFKPLQYQKVQIFNNNDELQFTGNIINTSLNSQSVNELQSVSGYSKAGILEDVTIPFSSYPLEKNNVSLSDIATSLLTPFGLTFSVTNNVANDMNINYSKTTAGVTENIKSYLSKLAAQRNIIITHDVNGDLVFTRPDITALPKYFFNDTNTLKMNLSVNGQAMHSQIDVIRQPSKNNIGVSTVDSATNSLVNANRPTVKILTSGDEVDTGKAANNILANELKGIGLSIALKNILDIKCGDIVEVQNDEVFLYSRTRFIVSEVSIKETVNADTMTLKLVLPETFTGDGAVVIW